MLFNRENARVVVMVNDEITIFAGNKRGLMKQWAKKAQQKHSSDLHEESSHPYIHFVNVNSSFLKRKHKEKQTSEARTKSAGRVNVSFATKRHIKQLFQIGSVFVIFLWSLGAFFKSGIVPYREH